jgi:hypothetical protein
MVAGGRWRGNIVNVYTEPWCEANQVGAAILHSSAEGRPLYESLGFSTTNEMR